MAYSISRCKAIITSTKQYCLTTLGGTSWNSN
nr:MAG TPA: hypothetical protein [Caudoviricetes sp.]